MALPNLPQDILDRIAALERQLREVTGRLGQRPAQTQIAGGDVSVFAGGSFRMLSFLGDFVQAWIGRILPNHPDGSEQRGILIYREDGSLAFAVYTADANAQSVSLRDRLGNTVVADDVVAGGLARPYLSTDAWYGVTEVPAFTTNSSTFVTLQNLPWIKQHPKIIGHYLVKADAGTAGEIRLVDDVGGVIAGPVAISSGGYIVGSVTGSLAGTPYSSTYLHWQARVTSGAGVIGVKGLSTFGVQS